jgi:hypothetical protein
MFESPSLFGYERSALAFDWKHGRDDLKNPRQPGAFSKSKPHRMLLT